MTTKNNPLLTETTDERMQRYMAILKEGNVSESVNKLIKVMESERHELINIVHQSKIHT